ncbi:F0F1 ATP synthase subunit epsilon [Candidatus Endoriftia persephonae]|jgi:F-type H+-transporting ATPase subunit epsilon|uniref:ATP synthase epsilon chain n=4 Tax=Gammaproteobacteria TaxID=1236 RepID=G2FGI8_9GAMM|nr:F0F1 ATP synthase subunit epsilon [Candidatus Endoriftia persephone]EGV52643.1 ATP synthase subunit epsilon [endosymbiont of Riftia pachyptila (vent Ph05)]EGW54099.1 ATP synthase epsilon chain [endosymbiont of Tevnia jerichonana (vent Tica)]KRT54045.1 ATP synthase F1 subcomplex epsilon subunit [endosymbiont of Ridgeia piscesae]KRT60244.1 ATP synthase F1 subcomplex epsilon subunit [endosymbiont of Ridgeia piscesae]USF87645.1 F0F1 ATP synthase subunit epsilon [Candidatus Endoriftia persephone
MAMTIHVDIVSAEGEIYSGLAEMVYAPAVMGEVGIAPRHTPLVTRLKPGEVRVMSADEMQHFYVSGGILEVQPHVVTVLADTAIRAHDLDEAAVQEAKKRAEEAMQDKSAEFEYAKAQSELAEAVAQLRAIERIRKSTSV